MTKAQDAWNKIALLSLVDHSFRNGRQSLDNVEIQKLSFLSEIEGRENDLKTAYFRFYRDKYGPYSTAVANTITCFEKLGLLNQENRELLDRGHYLLRYSMREIQRSSTAMEALGLIAKVAHDWKDYRGWSIKMRVYEIPFKVQELGDQELTMPNIPLYTEIVNPEALGGREIEGVSEQLISDIEAELAIPLKRLDGDSDEVWLQSLEELNEAFAR